MNNTLPSLMKINWYLLQIIFVLNPTDFPHQILYYWLSIWQKASLKFLTAGPTPVTLSPMNRMDFGLFLLKLSNIFDDIYKLATHYF